MGQNPTHFLGRSLLLRLVRGGVAILGGLLLLVALYEEGDDPPQDSDTDDKDDRYKEDDNTQGARGIGTQSEARRADAPPGSDQTQFATHNDFFFS